MNIAPTWKEDWQFIFAYCGRRDEHLKSLFDKRFYYDIAETFANKFTCIEDAEFLRNWLRFQKSQDELRNLNLAV